MTGKQFNLGGVLKSKGTARTEALYAQIKNWNTQTVGLTVSVRDARTDIEADYHFTI